MLAAGMFNRDFSPSELQDYVASKKICSLKVGFNVVTV
jgi:hypothetical protein